MIYYISNPPCWNPIIVAIAPYYIKLVVPFFFCFLFFRSSSALVRAIMLTFETNTLSSSLLKHSVTSLIHCFKTLFKTCSDSFCQCFVNVRCIKERLCEAHPTTNAKQERRKRPYRRNRPLLWPVLHPKSGLSL